MPSKVTIGGFAAALQGILHDYGAAAYPATVAATERTTKEVLRKTRAASPVGKSRKHYKSGWTSRVTVANSRTYARVVHNRTKYRLTHLLEHGHGGPYPAGARPHITQDAETEQIFVRELTKELEG